MSGTRAPREGKLLMKLNICSEPPFFKVPVLPTEQCPPTSAHGDEAGGIPPPDIFGLELLT